MSVERGEPWRSENLAEMLRQMQERANANTSEFEAYSASWPRTNVYTSGLDWNASVFSRASDAALRYYVLGRGDPATADGSGDDGVTREEMDAKIAAAEARGDTKLANLNGQLALIAEKLDDVRQGQVTSFWGVAGLIAAAVAAILTALAWGGDNFNTGREVGAQLAGIEAKLDSQMSSGTEAMAQKIEQSAARQAEPDKGPDQPEAKQQPK